MAARLGVDRTPSLVLIKKGNERFIPISSGVTTLEDIEDRLYRGIKFLEGQTTPQNWGLYDFQKGGGYDTTPPAGGSN